MSGFSIADLHQALVRSLRGRCLKVADGIVAKDGRRHEDCSTCEARCGAVSLGFSGGVEVSRVYGSDAFELRWPCPGCGVETTQETTALSSLVDAASVQADPLCSRCRKAA